MPPTDPLDTAATLRQALRHGDELSDAAAEFFLALEEMDEADSIANYEGPGDDDDTHERAAVIASRRVRDADLDLKKARLAWIQFRAAAVLTDTEPQG